MSALEISDLEDVLVGEIAEAGDWVIANLETTISWPVFYQKYAFHGQTYFIIPLTNNHYPAVALKRSQQTLLEARSSLLRFLSAMSWSESSGATVVAFTNGGLPRPMGREKSFGQTITADLNLTYLPEVIEARQGLALALMREGRGLNHPAYAFLSFYRVLEAAMPNGKARETWVAANLDAIMDRKGIEALAKLKQSGIKDVGTHLYKSGRMAIAHAGGNPVVNPDDASDYDRIAGELPIMRGLAELAIECVLEIKTRNTAIREHLYELAGFKKRLGAARVAAILSGQPPLENEQIDLPPIDIELRRKEPFTPFRAMQPVHTSQEGQCLLLVYRSNDGLVEIGFTLDFAEERLRFDWQSDINGQDDESAAAASHGAEICRFILEYVGNGELHVYDSETRALLSRVGEFIPVNYQANHKKLLKDIDDWNDEAKRRCEAGR